MNYKNFSEQYLQVMLHKKLRNASLYHRQLNVLRIFRKFLRDYFLLQGQLDIIHQVQINLINQLCFYLVFHISWNPVHYTIEYGNKIDAFVEAPTLYNRSVKEGLL